MKTTERNKKIMGTAQMKIAGTTFNNRQGKLWQLKKAEKAYLTLRREPTNKHDANAIRVYAHTLNGEKVTHFEIGYVPAEKAEWLAPAIDAGKYVRVTNYEVHVHSKNYLTAEMTLIHELYTVKETVTVPETAAE